MQKHLTKTAVAAFCGVFLYHVYLPLRGILAEGQPQWPALLGDVVLLTAIVILTLKYARPAYPYCLLTVIILAPLVNVGALMKTPPFKVHSSNEFGDLRPTRRNSAAVFPQQVYRHYRGKELVIPKPLHEELYKIGLGEYDLENLAGVREVTITREKARLSKRQTRKLSRLKGKILEKEERRMYLIQEHVEASSEVYVKGHPNAMFFIPAQAISEFPEKGVRHD